MRCARCGYDFSELVCPNCGTPAQYSSAPREARCARCGNLVYGSYCTSCGQPVTARPPVQPAYGYTYPPRQPAQQPFDWYPYPAQKKPSDDFGKIVSASWIIYYFIFLSGVAAFLGLLWWGASIALPALAENSCPDCTAQLLVIIPIPISILELSGISFLVYFVLVVTTISACFFWLLVTDGPTMVADFKDSVKKGWFSHSSKSKLILIGQLFAFGVFFNVAYNFIVLIFFGEGALPTGAEIDPPWYFLALIGSAAVWEEIVSRTLLIGVPLFIIAFLTNLSTKGEMKRPIRYLIGGGFNIGPIEFAFLVFSASMFAIAHIFASGPWVIPPLFVGGLILGYLFLKKGIVTSIMFHFIWNYSIAFTNVASIYGNYAMMWLGLAFTLFVAFVGLVYTFIMFAKILRKSKGEPETERQAEPQIVIQAQPQATTWAHPSFQTASRAGYQCPNCGNMTAIYKDGRFQCVQCGHVNQSGPYQGSAYR